MTNPQPLAGKVAVVAGATRGAGRGIARALAAAGAIVYCTGRSTRGNPSPYKRPETIEETAELIQSAGGAAIALRTDHTVEPEVESLFQRVLQDHGRLDILVNSIAGEDPLMGQWASFWETNLNEAAAILRQSLVSHILTAKHAAPHMIHRRSGLIVEVTENDTFLAGANTLAQIVKISHKALAALWAGELRPLGVTAVAITPGFLRSEAMLEHFRVTEANWPEGGRQDSNFLQSESPLYVGRAIAALAADPNVARHSGQSLSSWELSREYGFTDVDGRRPDWGAHDIDFSMLPASMLQALLDTATVQADWLQTLAGRTARYRDQLAAASRRNTMAK